MNRALLILTGITVLLVVLIVGIVSLIDKNDPQVSAPPLTENLNTSSREGYNETNIQEELSENTFYQDEALNMVFLDIKFLKGEKTSSKAYAITKDFKIEVFNKENKVILLTRDKDRFSQGDMKTVGIINVKGADDAIRSLAGKVVEVEFSLKKSCNTKLLSFLKGEIDKIDCNPNAYKLTYYEK
jgi:hypothetical protein